MKLREAFSKWWRGLSAVVQAMLVVCAAPLVIGLIATVIRWAPNWLASTHGLNASQRAEEVGRVRTALLAVLAGALAATRRHLHGPHVLR